ncbi:unnamed protein product, partial [Mesorhabditis spiculigera]
MVGKWFSAFAALRGNPASLPSAPLLYVPRPVSTHEAQRNHRRSGSLPYIGGTGSTPNGRSIASVGSTVKDGIGRRRADRRKKAREDTTEDDQDDLKELPRKGGRSCNPLINLGLRKKKEDDSDDEEEKSNPSARRRLPLGRPAGLNKKGPRAASNEKKPAQGARSAGGTGRKKAVFEEDSPVEQSSSSSSDSEDEPYRVRKNSQKSSKKGPTVNATNVKPKGRGRPPKAKKPQQRSPGKVFPPNYGRRGRSNTPPKSPTTPVQCASVATSVGTDGTVPMRMGEAAPSSPGGGRTMADVGGDDSEDGGQPPLPTSLPRPPPDPPEEDGPHIEQRSSRGVTSSLRSESRHSSQSNFRQKASRASSTDSSRSRSIVESDDDHIRHRPSSPASSLSSLDDRWRESPRPLGDLFPTHTDTVNMGGVPDMDDDEPSGSGDAASNDEAPPVLNVEPIGAAEPMSSGGNHPLSIPAFDDDDDAPPQLSPNIMDEKNDTATSSKSVTAHDVPDVRSLNVFVLQSAMDRPPKAPAMLSHPIEDEDPIPEIHHSLPGLSSGLPPVSQQIQMTPQSQHTLQYPGSGGGMLVMDLGQATPGSVGQLCAPGSVHQTTPEMPQFMSPPQMQPSCMQPGSVSSVHSVGAAGMNTSGGPHEIPPGYGPSTPATPLRHPVTPGIGPAQNTPPMSNQPAMGTSPYGMPLGPSPLCVPSVAAQSTPPMIQAQHQPPPPQQQPQPSTSQPAKRDKKKASSSRSAAHHAAPPGAQQQAMQAFGSLPAHPFMGMQTPLMPSGFTYPTMSYNQAAYMHPGFDPITYQQQWFQQNYQRAQNPAPMMQFYGGYAQAPMGGGQPRVPGPSSASGSGSGSGRHPNQGPTAGTSQPWPTHQNFASTPTGFAPPHPQQVAHPQFPDFASYPGATWPGPFNQTFNPMGGPGK